MTDPAPPPGPGPGTPDRTTAAGPGPGTSPDLATAPGPGSGTPLERGLAVALAAFDGTAADDLPARSRGVIALLEENCTACMLCARECPDWCVYIDSHTETVEVPGGRPRQRNVLDRFAIDFALCMYCGICVEVCPFDALFWAPEYEYAAGDVTELTHERDRLREWLHSVPPPPVLDPAGPVPKEVRQAGS